MDVIGSGERSSHQPKRRRSRKPLNCAECRRLKLRCDRTIPCSQCTRRGCALLCPDRVREPDDNDDTSLVNAQSRRPPPRPSEHELGNQSTTSRRLVSQSWTSLPDHARSRSLARDLRQQSSPRAHASTYANESHTRVGSAVEHTSPSRLGNIIGVYRAPGGTGEAPNPDLSSAMDLPFTADPEPSSNAPTLQALGGRTFSPSGNFAHPPDRRATVAEAVGFVVRDEPRVTTMNGTNVNAAHSHILQTSASGSHLPEDYSQGTLVMGPEGFSKYLGRSAASEWLRDTEAADVQATPVVSRPQSPGIIGSPKPVFDHIFPFSTHAPTKATAERLLSMLPHRWEANECVDSFYRYFAWHFDIVPRSTFQPVYEDIYKRKINRGINQERLHLQKLALVFSILALGALHNLELPLNDASAEAHAAKAKVALSKGRLLDKPQIAGIQALHILAHYQLQSESGSNGDATWPLWGLAMRLIQAMGVHRDGTKWELPMDVIQERRRVFWECHSADVFQANCFSRPTSILLDHVDTAFPSEYEEEELEHGQRSFFTLKFELSRIASTVLLSTMCIDLPSYAQLLTLSDRIVQFEREIPFELRCRPALSALPSLYSDPDTAAANSPEPNARNLRLTLQRFTLAINVSETILFLHRPYFARALHERRDEPTNSQFGQSYLAVIERCGAIIQSVASLHSLHRAVSCRQWFLWYHLFNSAVCLGTLIIQNPSNVLALFAKSQIDVAVVAYQSAVQNGHSSRLAKNLRWLLKLQTRAAHELTHNTGMAQTRRCDALDPEQEETEIELLGWRTRLIQKAGTGIQTATSIVRNSPAQATSTGGVLSPTEEFLQMLQDSSEAILPGVPPVAADSAESGNAAEVPTHMDELFHQFWDPMMLQDFPDVGSNAMTNWWSERTL